MQNVCLQEIAVMHSFDKIIVYSEPKIMGGLRFSLTKYSPVQIYANPNIRLSQYSPVSIFARTPLFTLPQTY